MAIRWPWTKRHEPQERHEPVVKSWTMTNDEGWMNTSWDPGWWQQNLRGPQGVLNETVEGCMSALAQTVAMCPIHHYKDLDNGSSERLRGSNVERVLKFPNPYQSRTQFFNAAIRCMYSSGNGIALATRDNRGAVSRLDLLDPVSSRGVFSAETGEAYYWIAPYAEGAPVQDFNDDTDFVVPARDILNLRINVGRDPLKGQSPIQAAAASIAASSELTGQQANFYKNMMRPSGGLFTDKDLTKEQTQQLRQRANEQMAGRNAGGIGVFSHGLDYKSMSLTSQDAQLVEAYGMTVEGIARAFRVPLPLINDLRNSTFNNAESLMIWFLSSGLGFLLENIELELSRLFGLPFNERINFDEKALLRSDWKSRIETLGEGVLKGIYAPNEARAFERLPPVEDGDEPRVQQQVVPLSGWNQEAPEPIPEPADDEIEAAFYHGVRKAANE